MSVTTLRPNATDTLGSATLTGAATAHAALSDNSDSSYIGTLHTYSPTQVEFDDFTLPGGATIIGAQLRVRTAVLNHFSTYLLSLALKSADGVVNKTAVSTVNWMSITTITPIVLSEAITDAEADSLYVQVSLAGSPITSGISIRVYELYIDIFYVSTPVTSVTGPTGTVNNTTSPTVTWTNTSLDGDGGGQSKFQVRVFSAAQYGAGGFDPATSTATSDSGQVTSASQSFTIADTLPDASYRAYVRIAQTVNGVDNWSAYAFTSFSTHVDKPATPSIVAHGENYRARIRIDINANSGVATTDLFEVQRSLDGGTTWETARTVLGDGLLSITDDAMYDNEVANAASVKYRARALHNYSGFYASSDWATSSSVSWTGDDWWLKSPSNPELDINLTIDSLPSIQRPVRQGVFPALGSSTPIIVSDNRGSARGTLRLRLDTKEEQDALDALLDLASPLLLQGAPADNWTDRYVMFGDSDRARLADKSWIEETFDTLPWIEVSAPNTPIAAWPEDNS